MNEILSVTLPVFFSSLGIVISTWISKRAEKRDKSKQEIMEKLSSIESSISDIIYTEKVILKDRISHLGCKHIKEKYISLEERENLIELHDAYHNQCKGNGNLDALMNDVKNLPLK